MKRNWNSDYEQLVRKGQMESIEVDELIIHAKELIKRRLNKYGNVYNRYPDEACAYENIETRLTAYEKTGNLKYLADIYNFAMIEYSYPSYNKSDNRTVKVLVPDKPLGSQVRTYLRQYKCTKNIMLMVIIANLVIFEYSKQRKAGACMESYEDIQGIGIVTSRKKVS